MLTRAITALFGVLTLVAIWYFFASQGLLVACALVTLIATTEFSMMVERRRQVIRSLFTCISFAFYLVFSFYSHSILTFLAFFILLVSYFILFSDSTIEERMAALASWTVGILYCGVFTGIVSLGILKFGGNYFVALLGASFLTDTFAYLGGRFFGKHPIAPKISPKKTLEGSLAGLLGGATFTYFFLNQLEHNSPQFILIITALMASIFTQVGDLFESMLKRYSGVKDSGRIMPGHGGILDRIDGLLFTAPLLFLWMELHAVGILGQ